MTPKFLLLAALALPTYKEDRAPELAEAKAQQLHGIVEAAFAASEGAPRSRAEWTALLLAIAYHESTFSLRIHAGDCKPHECDAQKIRLSDGRTVVYHRARSLWQMHRNRNNAAVWDQLVGLENTEVQARAASDMLKRAYFRCAKSGSDWISGTIAGYAGRRCDARWPGLEARLKTYGRLVGK
jgi:hypothetical protein